MEQARGEILLIQDADMEYDPSDYAAILPDYDARPEPLMALLAMGAPRGVLVVGIDRDAAMVGRDGVWEVHGPARVTVWRGLHRRRHRSGEAFRISDSAE